VSEKRNELNGISDEHEEIQVSEALRHFRESVHAWSEEEYARPRISKRKSTFFMMRRPALNWAAAAVLGITVVAVPAIHHLQQERSKSSQKVDYQKPAAEKQMAYANDEELLSHVDEDIAQDTPDAMEPLASLMTESSARR